MFVDCKNYFARMSVTVTFFVSKSEIQICKENFCFSAFCLLMTGAVFLNICAVYGQYATVYIRTRDSVDQLLSLEAKFTNMRGKVNISWLSTTLFFGGKLNHKRGKTHLSGLYGGEIRFTIHTYELNKEPICYSIHPPKYYIYTIVWKIGKSKILLYALL